MPLTSRRPLRRKTRMKSSKPIRKVNPERQAKRRAEYRKKLAAYRRSETYRLVEARAGGRCEGMDTVMYEACGPDYVMRPFTVEPYRCYADRRYPDGTKLTHHHKTYARFGGKELPEDIIVLCDRHNREAESKYPTRNRRWQADTEGRK